MSEFTYILAADPGLMTGWAWTALQPGWHDTRAEIFSGQLPSDQFCDWAADAIDERVLVIFESFTVNAQTARKSPQPEPMEVIGVLKFLARRAGAQYESQTPSAAKNFVTDAQLRKLGLCKKGEDHARDALRHLVLGIVSHCTGQLREELLQSLA